MNAIKGAAAPNQTSALVVEGDGRFNRDGTGQPPRACVLSRESVQFQCGTKKRKTKQANAGGRSQQAHHVPVISKSLVSPPLMFLTGLACSPGFKAAMTFSTVKRTR